MDADAHATDVIADGCGGDTAIDIVDGIPVDAPAWLVGNNFILVAFFAPMGGDRATDADIIDILIFAEILLIGWDPEVGVGVAKDQIIAGILGLVWLFDERGDDAIREYRFDAVFATLQRVFIMIMEDEAIIEIAVDVLSLHENACGISRRDAIRPILIRCLGDDPVFDFAEGAGTAFNIYKIIG